MKWILKCLIDEYGKEKWLSMPEQDQLYAIVAFGEDLGNAIDFLRKIKQK